MRIGLLLACLAGFLLARTALGEEPPPVDGALLSKMRHGGYVVYFRHASTQTGGEGDRDVDYADCATQRNLSDAGRKEAREIGRAWRALHIPVGTVTASPFCRTKETAKLAFGRVEVDRDLAFAIDVSPAERKRLGAALARRLAAAPAPGKVDVLVAHTANLREAAGLWPKPEGAAYVFQPLHDGGFRAVARMTPADWSALAAGHARR
jgi:phosphohistidine phosphatase SixA